MLRPTLTAIATALTLFGCASTPTSEAVVSRVTPGLANVPWISHSTYIDDLQSPDVVSNGPEACGRGFENSPLWNQWPPCPRPATTPASAGRLLLPTSDDPASTEEVRPWQEVTLFEWPCTPAGEQKGDAPAVVLCR
jgi:hypothetical protein